MTKNLLYQLNKQQIAILLMAWTAISNLILLLLWFSQSNILSWPIITLIINNIAVVTLTMRLKQHYEHLLEVENGYNLLQRTAKEQDNE